MNTTWTCSSCQREYAEGARLDADCCRAAWRQEFQTIHDAPETPRPTFPSITKDLAQQFALILSSGMPHLEAIRYFAPASMAGHPKLLAGEVDRWMKHRDVQAAIRLIQGKDWQAMDLPERITFAINKHYTEMAYFLYANNYNDLDGHSRAKADIVRQALEAKLAGTAGQRDALSQFMDDIRTGKVKLGKAMVQ